MYLAGGSVKGDFEALIQGGAKKRREGRVRDLKRVTDLNVLGGSQENAVLCTMVASGDIPFCVRSVRVRRLRPPTVSIPRPCTCRAFMPEAGNVGVRGVYLPRRWHKPREDGGVISVAVYGSDGLHSSLS